MIRNIGIAVPSEYAKVIRNASSVTVPVIANEITDASIGPTQGVHNSPSERPTITPAKNPGCVCVRGSKLMSLENNFSVRSWN